MTIINIKEYDYVINKDGQDYRLKIYTDGYIVEEGWFLQLGGGKHIWETQGKIAYDVRRKIKRTKNNIELILKEIMGNLIVNK